MDERKKYFQLLAEKYPTMRALSREIINLTAILNLPKGTEHFMSDLHGEYEAFYHILNNCSGVIREKVDRLYGDTLSDEERKELCTLIYYPKEKLRLLRDEGVPDREWYTRTLNIMIELARTLSSKYTRSKVRKAMPEDYAYILDELLHAQKDEDDNQVHYHKVILDTVIEISAEDFLISLAELLKRLAVDRLHIVGDIFDRGDSADKIMELLTARPPHSLDIEWGNHDILWMGAAAGSEACIANVVRNCIKYSCLRTLENGYGVSLRKLTLFAQTIYPDLEPMDAALKAICVIQFKLEGQTILRHPEYEMNDRLLLDKVHDGQITIDGKTYTLSESRFPTVSEDSPYALTEEEQAVIDRLKAYFTGSAVLRRHVAFLYEKGGMYRCHNGNLLYHGCVPLTPDGDFDAVEHFGQRVSGRAYFDLADSAARRAFFSRGNDRDALDFMWYLWCGRKSPLCGRNIKTFERTYIADKTAWTEEKNPYYTLYHEEAICGKILSEFGLVTKYAHIVNGHTPVRTVKGELPIRANGKLLVIDGGFCREYHDTTGIAGYTLIFNSHGLRLKAHQPFESVGAALRANKDIRSSSEIVETERYRVMVDDTDRGERIRNQIADLFRLLQMYKGAGSDTK
ncbi:MAG: fructose-1,6-bisphosphatase [Ruminococcus sp.]|nr:fructose-1,6-bisphosphatase [Ruminococcus sp.]